MDTVFVVVYGDRDRNVFRKQSNKQGECWSFTSDGQKHKKVSSHLLCIKMFASNFLISTCQSAGEKTG